MVSYSTANRRTHTYKPKSSATFTSPGATVAFTAAAHPRLDRLERPDTLPACFLRIAARPAKNIGSPQPLVTTPLTNQTAFTLVENVWFENCCIAAHASVMCRGPTGS